MVQTFLTYKSALQNPKIIRGFYDHINGDNAFFVAGMGRSEKVEKKKQKKNKTKQNKNREWNNREQLKSNQLKT